MMRTVTVEYKAYAFCELSKEAKENALEEQRQSIYETYTQEYVLDIEREELENIGFSDVDIEYSGFWSQGDGASFTAKDIDLQTFMKSEKISNKYRAIYANAEYIRASVDRISHHYSHENTVTANIDLFYCDHLSKKQFEVLEKQTIEFESYLDEWVKERSRSIYDHLEQDYEYTMSNESIMSEINDLDLEFTKEGSLL